MAPRHDEIVKTTADGFTVAWDTTVRVDEARVRAVEKVVKEQALELGAIFGTADVFANRDDAAKVRDRLAQRGRTRP
jgi:hypothetical protein